MHVHSAHLCFWLHICKVPSVIMYGCHVQFLIINGYTHTSDAESLFFGDSDSRVRKFRTPDSDSGTKRPGLRLWAQNQTPTPTPTLGFLMI